MYNNVGKSVLLKCSITKLELELKLTMAKSWMWAPCSLDFNPLDFSV